MVLLSMAYKQGGRHRVIASNVYNDLSFEVRQSMLMGAYLLISSFVFSLFVVCSRGVGNLGFTKKTSRNEDE